MSSNEHIADFEVLRDISMATIFGFLYTANMTEPSMCGSDAALCQITLTTCLLLLRGVCVCGQKIGSV